MNQFTKFAILNANYISKRLENHFPSFRACLKTARRAAARDFGCGQGGAVGASPQRAVTTKPTPPTGKRPAAQRVFAQKAAWLRCSSVEDPRGVFSFVAPRHTAFSPKTARLGVFNQALDRSNGLVAHECILDLRAFKSVTAEDVAKRLMDYGFHAPTLSWPVAGTLMVEPTESESQYELDRFCDAMISIHAEMTAVENGSADPKNNLLKGAPHTADMIASDNWNKPYTREQAAFPAKSLHDYKFWPHVGRVDNVYGDRNPVCSCVGMEAYET